MGASGYVAVPNVQAIGLRKPYQPAGTGASCLLMRPQALTQKLT